MKMFLLCSVALFAFVSSDLTRAAGTTPDEILARIEAIENENASLRSAIIIWHRE